MAICYQNYEMSWFFWYRLLLVPTGAFWENLNQTFLFWQKFEKNNNFWIFCFIYGLVYVCLHKVNIICINPYLSFLLLIYTFLTILWEFITFWDLENFYDFYKKIFFWPILITYIWNWSFLHIDNFTLIYILCEIYIILDFWLFIINLDLENFQGKKNHNFDFFTDFKVDLN